MRPSSTTSSALSSSALSYLESLEKDSRNLRNAKNPTVSKQRTPSISEIISQARRRSSLTRTDSEDVDFLNESLKSSMFSEDSGEKLMVFSDDSDNEERILPRGTPGQQVGRKSLKEIRELRNSIDQSLIKTPEVTSSREIKKMLGGIAKSKNQQSFEKIDEEDLEDATPKKAKGLLQKTKSPFKKFIESESSDAESIVFDEVFEDFVAPEETVKTKKAPLAPKAAPKKPKPKPKSSSSESSESSESSGSSESSESESTSESSSSETSESSESSTSSSSSSSTQKAPSSKTSVATVVPNTPPKSSPEPEIYEDDFPSASTVREDPKPQIKSIEVLKEQKKKKEKTKHEAPESPSSSSSSSSSSSDKLLLEKLRKLEAAKKLKKSRNQRREHKEHAISDDQSDERCHTNVHNVMQVVLNTHLQMITEFNQAERQAVNEWKEVLERIGGHDGPTTDKLKKIIENRINRNKYF